jgi:mannose-1-phosphate guanylyltransferase
VAASLIQAADKDGIMIVMPSDHVIEPRSEFHRAIQAGVQLIEQDPERIVTFGIRPTYPAESFGYIERGSVLEGAPGVAAFEVQKFREKPKMELAEEFFKAGTFYWNSGIFLWSAKTVLGALKAYEPEMFAQIEKIAQAIGKPNFQSNFVEHFEAIRGKSIDYAVMEKHPKVAVIEAPFQWDDVGSWQAMSRLLKPDSHGNAVEGPFLGIDSQNLIVRTDPDHLVVTIGMKDVIVVHTKDATLVAPKHQEERVREVVKQLQELGLREYL